MKILKHIILCIEKSAEKIDFNCTFHMYIIKLLHLFAWRHQVLVGFQDVCERFLDVLLLHAGQHRWRQKLCQTPLLSIKTRRETRAFTLNSNAFHLLFSFTGTAPQTFPSPSCRSNPNHFLSLVKTQG